MTVLNFDEDVAVLISQLEKSLFSTEWGELRDTLEKSTQVFGELHNMSESLLPLEVSNDSLFQNANRILEKNIGVVGSIFQFCVNSSFEFDLHSACGKLAKFLPELEITTNVFSHVQESDLKPDSGSGQNLSSHLCNVMDAMNYILEFLPFFKLAFFACNEASFCTQEYARASSKLTELVMILESKSVPSYEPTNKNRLLEVFLNTLDRPFKIAMSALWLLFTFPAIESLKFDVILGLCQRAVQIFVCAIDILNGLMQFLLKKIALLKTVQDEIYKRFKLVREFCDKILELTPSDVRALEELSKNESGNLLKDTSCKSASILEVTQENTILKSTASSSKLQETSAVESANSKKDTNCDISDESQAITPIKQAGPGKNTHCNGVGTSEEPQITSSPVTMSQNYSNFNLKTIDTSRKTKYTSEIISSVTVVGVKFHSLNQKQKKIVQEIIDKINSHKNNFSFVVRPTESGIKVVCKICSVISQSENFENHIKDQKHQWRLYKKCKKNRETRAVVTEISEDNWQFLSMEQGGFKCWCSLCMQQIGPSINAWMQHFNGLWHRKELKKLSDHAQQGGREYFKDHIGRRQVNFNPKHY